MALGCSTSLSGFKSRGHFVILSLVLGRSASKSVFRTPIQNFYSFPVIFWCGQADSGLALGGIVSSLL